MNSNNYDKDDLESVLRYLTHEYGIEILAGQGTNPGKEDVMRLLPDFFSTRHKGDYSMMRMMGREGIMTNLLSLKESGIPDDECRRLVAIETQKLKDNYIPEDIAAKFVNMIAEVIGLKTRVSVNSAVHVQQSNSAEPPAPAPSAPVRQRKPAARTTRKRPAMRKTDFIDLCRAGDITAVQLALHNGANPNAKDEDGNTALHKAAYTGNTGLAAVLLQHGANPNAKDEDGNTALHQAIYTGNTGLAAVLLQYGANPNIKDEDGYTPMHLAASRGNFGIIAVLRRYGAR